MGQEFSQFVQPRIDPEIETDPIKKVQAYANVYFSEYQKKSMNDISFAQGEVDRWQSVMPAILDYPIEQQAEYADYVTNKICMLPLDILLPFIRDSVAEKPTVSYKQLGSCAVGNMAKMILMLPEPEQTVERKLFAEALKK